MVPGVGAFAACMAGLTDVGGPGLIARRRGGRAADAGHLRRPPGAVRRRHRARRPRRRLRRLARAGGAAGRPPAAAHGLEHRRAGRRAAGCSPASEDERFYFVHCYGVRVLEETPGRRVTWAEHEGDRFVAAVEEGPLWSTQFHPEKSGEAGTGCSATGSRRCEPGPSGERPAVGPVRPRRGACSAGTPRRAFAGVLPAGARCAAFLARTGFGDLEPGGRRRPALRRDRGRAGGPVPRRRGRDRGPTGATSAAP